MLEGFVSRTEWKIVNRLLEAETKCREAREQTKRYMSGVLGGTELTGYRYIVLVSGKRTNCRKTIKEGGIEYRRKHAGLRLLHQKRHECRIVT